MLKYTLLLQCWLIYNVKKLLIVKLSAVYKVSGITSEHCMWNTYNTLYFYDLYHILPSLWQNLRSMECMEYVWSMYVCVCVYIYIYIYTHTHVIPKRILKYIFHSSMHAAECYYLKVWNARSEFTYRDILMCTY